MEATRKKAAVLLTVLFFHLLTPSLIRAQEEAAATADTTEMVDSAATAAEEAAPAAAEVAPEPAPEEAPQDQSFHQVVKRYFLEGDWRFMTPVLICLILGLAIAIERIIVLNLKDVNEEKLLAKVEEYLKKGDVNGAKELLRKTPGPIATVLLQSLDRKDEGIEVVEKSIVATASVEMSRLEKGLTWISLFIAVAPMLGFMGTVIGMIQSFTEIEAAGDISPSIVAGGIKVALLTTVAGLIVAIILQIFYNYLLTKIEGIVTAMEDASIAFVDMLIKHGIVKTNASQ